MSCIQLSDNHINYLVSYFLKENPTANPQVMAQVLADENLNSCNYRYKESDDSYEIKFKSVPTNPYQALMAAQSYEYQTCESPYWKSEINAARRYIELITAIATREILEEYETKHGELKWCID